MSTKLENVSSLGSRLTFDREQALQMTAIFVPTESPTRRLKPVFDCNLLIRMASPTGFEPVSTP
jgi:hypothetical protein